MHLVGLYTYSNSTFVNHFNIWHYVLRDPDSDVKQTTVMKCNETKRLFKWPNKLNNRLLNTQRKGNISEESDHNRKLKNSSHVLWAPQSIHSSKTYIFSSKSKTLNYWTNQVAKFLTMISYRREILKPNLWM